MQEIWKDIQGYEGLYQISNTGKVKSLGRFVYNGSGMRWNAERILKCKDNGHGYLNVCLARDKDDHKYAYIHRLVATHFVENPSGLPQVNHKDENKSNNNAENLEWCDMQYNNTYGTKIQRGVANMDYASIAKRRSVPVYQINLDGTIVRRHNGMSDAARKFGFKTSEISSCCKDKKHTHAGFRWMYASEYEVR